MRQWYLACLLTWSSIAHAHLVVNQHGTLNFLSDGAYMVVSLPLSAFSGVDDDQDGLLSLAEMHTHTSIIESQIRRGIKLHSEQGPSALEGLMLNTAAHENAPSEPATHMLVLGRFQLAPGATNLKFDLQLFGTKSNEKTEHFTVTRGTQSQLITLTPDKTSAILLPSTLATFIEQMKQGASHVLSGTDHLLFLLLALLSSSNFRQVFLVFTVFTAGHALTLIACNLYGFTPATNLIEPLIAATLVCLAVFDRWFAQRSWTHPILIRMGLVFVFACIHGLALAEALNVLGVNGPSKIITLAGFNVGIELGQLVVAFPALLIMLGLKKFIGSTGLHKTTHFISFVSMGLGCFWFLQRSLV